MITAIIQARTGSTRLPNKIFARLADKSLIDHVVERLKFSALIQKIVLATTVNPNDDVLEFWARDHLIDVYRGSENDVLARYYHAAKAYRSSMVVRITADDPFKDPQIIDSVIRLLQSDKLDFAYNNKPPSFPEGLDTEVFTVEALERAFRESRDAYEREHVTQYLYRHPEKFSQKNFSYKKDISSLRWTIDTNKDLEMVQTIYSKLYQPGKIFLMDDILDLLNHDHTIASINSDVQRSAMYLKTAELKGTRHEKDL